MKAFPTTEEKWNEISQDFITVKHLGMDLRDYFAAKAMQADISIVKLDGSYDEGHWGMDQIAKRSYEMANEMMKAREK